MVSHVVTSKKYPFISYIKAFAIIMIIITHCRFSITERMHIFFPFLIETAVPFFMLITGFNYAKSYEIHNISKFVEMYNLKQIFRRLLRLAIPFTVFALVEWFLVLPVFFDYGHSFFTFYINGGLGPGSYYFPVMAQIIVLYPLLYFAISKYKEKGLVLIFLLNALFELVCALTNITNSAYRMISLRYLFVVAAGIYISKKEYKGISNNILVISFVLGCLYLALSTYIDKDIFYPFVNWKSTSALSTFYVFAIFMWVYNYFNFDKLKNNVVDKILQIIGNATWHIFLAQCLYYAILWKFDTFSGLALYITIPLNIFITLVTGILFYYFDIKILKPLLRY